MHSSLILSESLRQTISKEMLCGVLGAVVRLGSRAAVFMRMPYGDAYAARGLAASLQRRQLCAASSDLDDQMKMLHDNPHYAKYGAKLERMRREAPDAFRAKVEEKTRKSETQKMAGDSYDERLTSSAPPPPAPAHLAPPMAKPKTLYDIMKVDLLRGLSADEISLVWTEHHTSRGRLCAAVPAAAYERMAALARECPAFVFALPRGDGYETFLAQFSGNDCHFTPLLGYKTHGADAPACLTLTHYTELAADAAALVLMVGERDDALLSALEAQCLANQLQLYYAQGCEDRTRLVRAFTHEPQSFDYQDVIRQLNNTELTTEQQ